MKVILSCTDNPLYSFFLPIATWSWKRLGVHSIVFVPEKQSDSFKSAKLSCPAETRFETLNIAADREPTYFQCARLFAGALPYIDDNEEVITSDADMAVFDYILTTSSDDSVHVYGNDLVPDGQYPICYAKASKKNWNKFMNVDGKTVNECLSELLDHIQCDNMRGNHWSRDQEQLFQHIHKNDMQVVLHNRRKSDQNRTARDRADRDGWEYNANTIIDAHLPRPGHELYNFNLILKLFKDVYPQEHFGRMMNYRNAFLTLLDK